MTDSLFCPNCGMLKENCVCGKYKNSNKSNSLDDFSNKKPNNAVDDIIPDVYSIENHKLNNDRINQLKKEYPNIDNDIIENFPFKEPRTGQLDIIQNIEDAISKGYKYIVLEAGTGTGKSAVATTLANIYGSAYILTMTKQLQHQYSKEFGFPIVKGRSNFSCLMGGSESTCDMGVCKTTVNSKKFFCPFSITKVPKLTSTLAFEDSFGNDIYYNSDNHCNYWEQKANAINSPITLMNYDYAILELNYVKHFGTRSLLILDEAHNIENKLMNSLELTLSNQRLEKDIKRKISKETLKDGSVEDWILELESLYESYQDVDLKDLPMNKVDRIRRTISRIKLLRDHLEHEPKNWVIDSNEYSVSFKPLRVNKYAKDNLLKYGDICILQL